MLFAMAVGAWDQRPSLGAIAMNTLCRFATAALPALILTSLAAPKAHATPISATLLGYDLVQVGNPGNAADPATANGTE